MWIAVDKNFDHILILKKSNSCIITVLKIILLKPKYIYLSYQITKFLDSLKRLNII